MAPSAYRLVWTRTVAVRVLPALSVAVAVYLTVRPRVRFAIRQVASFDSVSCPEHRAFGLLPR